MVKRMKFGTNMKRILRLRCIPIIALLIPAAGCGGESTTIGLPKEGPYIGRAYDHARKGLQITRLYYDEEANRRAGAPYNEWFVLQSDTNLYIRGWWIDAGQGVRTYAFPDTLRKILLVYTRPLPGPPTDTEVSLDRDSWIWDRHDTLRIYNSRSELVAMLGY